MATIQRLIGITPRILLVCAKHTGSNLFCTPAIRLIKDQLPGSHIEVVALNKLSAEVFEGNADIDALHITQSRWRIRKLTKSADLALCLNPKSAPLLAGALCYTDFVPTFLNEHHQADTILEFVAGIFGLTAGPNHRNYVMTEGAVPTELVGNQDNLIGLHLGCGKTAKHGWKFFHTGRGTHQKLWPIERYIQLSRMIKQRFLGFRIVITGTRNEAFLGRQFVEAQPDTINLIGQTSAQSLFAAIERMDAFVTHDCGVLHIASATETPIISMFGSTFPAETGPYPQHPNRVVLQSPSMSDIAPDLVLNSLDRLFPPGRTKTPPVAELISV